jgi:tRNA G18 (ribose-2'-O)-methylase SpoU
MTSTSTELWDETRMSEPSLLKYNVHTPLQSLETKELQTISEKLALPIGLMMYNLNGDMNIGMAIRTAVIFGCSDVYIVGKKRYDRRPEVGAKNYIRVHRHTSLPLNFFRENKLLPIVLEQGGTPLEDFNFRPYLPEQLEPGWKVVFLVGNESMGFPQEFMKTLGAPRITISQYGIMRSLNVSIASSILLYEYTRQWRAAACARI